MPVQSPKAKHWTEALSPYSGIVVAWADEAAVMTVLSLTSVCGLTLSRAQGQARGDQPPFQAADVIDLVSASMASSTIAGLLM